MSTLKQSLLHLSLVGLCSSGLLSLSTAALAAPEAAAKPAAKAAAPAKPAPKNTKVVKGKPAAKPAPVDVVLAEANEEQLYAASRAYMGQYDCEFKQTIHITKHPKTEGYLDVAWQKQVFTMKPVLSSTGALRLEDVTGRTLMIQIANKSMLMDTHVGQRLVDECINPEQRTLIDLARAAAAEAAASGIEATGGLGIAPAPAAAVAATAAPVKK
ncbi:hypothetical protein HNP55_002564 [Paucibacter oligotrophus]|uniref:Uncharacterized protein n=1 Tax=Roseateles oligotrophus TaxID=1769250 RepID=A0A840LCV7_9BURK|nr:hypothetical protein [Roseateles oligotrophus]MBB4844028.1 hypothetical protein [Roseateles oligotrophus]